MAKLYDWVKQTVSGTPGTGAITLSTASATYITAADAGISDGETVYYTIVDGNNRERGVGTYSSTGPTLTRTFIQAKLESGVHTLNPGTGLTLTSAAIVGCSPVAATHNFRGCLVNQTASQTLTADTNNPLQWGNEIYDTDGFHDNVTNNSRFTIPSNKGIKKVRVVSNVGLNNGAVSSEILIVVTKNGSEAAGLPLYREFTGSGNYFCRNFHSATIDVTDGDYLECSVYPVATGKSTYYNASLPNYNWFGLEVVE